MCETANYCKPMPQQARQIPVLPVLDPLEKHTSGDGVPAPPSVLDVGVPVYCDSGSTAIYLALMHAQISSGDEVIVPAYHCPTMADPVISLGARVVFCDIQQDTSIDPDSLMAVLSERSRAILVPHFFGKLQDTAKIRDLCAGHSIVLIEDCAHAFYGQRDGIPVGALGDYAIASTRKFFPGADGGCLVSSKRDLRDLRVASLSVVDELRAQLDVIEDAQSFDRLGRWGLLAGPLFSLKRKLRGGPAAAEADQMFEPDCDGEALPVTRPRAMSRVSRRLLASADRPGDIAARCTNYRYLHDAFGRMPGIRPLFEAPDAVAVPYMFPLLVDDPAIYLEMRRRGLPAWRWDDSSPSCPVSKAFASHLLQIPCHQSLHRSDLDALVSGVAELAGQDR